MANIDLSSVPRLRPRYDPVHWQATNPLHHPTVYCLSQEELEMWAGEATLVRKQFIRKAELYQTYSSSVKKPSNKMLSRRQVPHSTVNNNHDGLFES